ncbi:MAG: RrF2 family transcriptional regulator [Salinivirgaceae bacterium]|jgi:Rrf2 family iron-sulfur cluster assembly transcriptional regulator|nr:Rrf2 family transcriptional regulator [Bacteroidales bacterium]
MISNTCKYAIRAMIYLALNEDKNSMIGIKQIASDLDIPQPFLSKILQQITRHKLLLSNKGPNGGFMLAKPASEISLMDIVTIIDGSNFFETCIIGLNRCDETLEHAHCPIHNDFSPVRKELKNLFEKKTIGLLAVEISNSGGNIRI